MNYEDRLVELVLADERVMRLLRTVRRLELEQWCIAAGTIRNLVWDDLHGLPEPTLPSDIDVLIFDDARIEPSYEAELEQKLSAQVPEVRWEVVNQATIHHYTGDATPYTSIAHAMSRWADLVTAVGVHLDATGAITVTSPGGLDDLFELRVRPNIATPTSVEVYRQRMASKGWRKRWPRLIIDDLEPSPLVTMRHVGDASEHRRIEPASLSVMALDVVFGSPLPDVLITGDRYLLRPFRHDDLHVVEAASRDDFIAMLTTVPSSYTPQEGLAFIDRQNQRLSSGEGWSLAVVERSTDRAVGQIGLWIPQLRKGRAEIGYWIAEPGRGNGAASEAVKLLSDWAFEHLDLDRLSLFIEPWNTASLKTAERAGYEREAMLTSWERVGGVPRDMWSYVQLRVDHRP